MSARAIRRLISKLQHGTADNLARPSDFDGQAYLKANPDVAASGMDPWTHYISHGKNEGRPYPAIGSVEDIYLKTIRSGYFDPVWYIQQYPDIRKSKYSPLRHFCDFGVWEGRDPGPHFSTSWYLEQYPDIRGLNPLEHFIDHGIREGRSSCPPPGALDTMEQTFPSLEHLDPQLGSNPVFGWPKGTPISDGRLRGPSMEMKQILRGMLQNISAETRRVILAPWCIYSGSDSVVANILHASEQQLGKHSTALIIVDHNKIEGTSWLPPEQTVINFASATAPLSRQDRMLTLEKLLVAISPDACLNANSHLGWDLFKHRGAALASYTQLFACLFCPDFDHKKRPAGYAHSHFRDCVSYLTGIISDNASFPKELSTDLHLLPSDADKFCVLRQPPRRPGVAAPLPVRRQIRNVGVHVLWAGRICRQKNFRLLAEIINLAPDQFKFSIYGWGDDASLTEFKALIAKDRRTTLHGSYDGFHSLPLESIDALLYTSLWDGIPNVILEAGSHGLPVIASNAGAVGEVINDTRGWLIDDIDSPHGYLEALNEVMTAKETAREKGISLRNFIAEAHSWSGFSNAIRTKGGFLHEASSNDEIH